MDRMIINGGKILSGSVRISGAKNSAVALIPAAILSDDIVKINGVPNISDIKALEEILVYLGAKITNKNGKIVIDTKEILNKEIPEHVSKKLRASYYFMSVLLGKYKKVSMYFPGGCNIGKRPIDQTLKAFRALGATVIENDNKYDIYADELIGNEINLDMPSVGATINAIFASVKAKGQTIINNSAQEPEIDNVIDFLNNMGADIKRDKTSIIINGVEHLHSSEINVIPDRIEAGTYLILGALIGDNLKVENVIPEHISSLLDKFDEMGVNYKIDKNSIIVSKTDNLKPVEVITKGYPGFATDLQQPFTVLLTQCDGVSHLTETIYENRFQNVEYLNSMGANIKINERTIEITGKTKLTANTVKATDLRAGACMVLASLIADGKTIIEDINHVLRGYENIIQKLQNIGAKIEE
ncbi:MAG: UDP-N-acetylglucosamine 1-carboxyvinyltransferase [Bacilli bacterium]